MNIMFFYSSLKLGGAERVISNLANKFSELGHDVTILTIDNNKSSYKLNNMVKHITLDGLKSNKNIYKRIKFNIKNILLIRKKMKKVKPDICIAYGLNCFFIAFVSKIGLRIKIIGSERSDPSRYKRSILNNFIINFITPLGNGFVFLSNYAKLFYPKKVQKKSVIIPNPLNDSFTSYDIISVDKRIRGNIIAVGRLHKVKDYTTMIKAFKIFSEKNQDYTLSIYGEGKEKESLQILINELSLSNKVFLKGYANDINKVYANAQMYVLSSIHEGYPNALIESLSFGVPSISTIYSDGVYDIIEDGINGLLVPVGDEYALAEAMEKIANSIDIQKTLFHNALQVRDKNNINKIAEDYLIYISKIVKEK